VIFGQILNFAKQYGLSSSKKRAILREYLQVYILSLLYQQKESVKLSFIGGTSLRLLNGLDRFSEDLDFDNLGLNQNQIKKMFTQVYQNLVKQNFKLDFYQNLKSDRAYFELRFKDLLTEFKISNNPKEKLKIKLDYACLWQGQKIKTVLLSRYGFIFNLITNNLGQLLVQKLYTYLKREQTQPRDIYDIIWLLGQQAKVDREFMVKNNLPTDLIKQAKAKFQRESNKLAAFKRRLRPFLINEANVNKLDLFLQVLS